MTLPATKALKLTSLVSRAAGEVCSAGQRREDDVPPNQE
jgi:hypothetical protein